MISSCIFLLFTYFCNKKMTMFEFCDKIFYIQPMFKDDMGRFFAKL